MKQWGLVVSLLMSIAGCAHWSEFLAGNRPGVAAPSTQATAFNFDWELSGEPRVAPVQVFDDGHRTWLQFQPQQVLPAIFERTPSGEVLLGYRRHLDYVVLDTVVSELLFQGGSAKAYAHRLEAVEPPASVQEPLALANEEVPIALPAPEITNDAEPALAIPGLDALDITPLSPVFVVQPSDGTLRQAIARWAKQADWTFMPEHWAVDVDIPISARAEFSGSFVEAVQHLLASTELADRPLQPCFYTNQVVRVVPYAQACRRGSTVAVGMAS